MPVTFPKVFEDTHPPRKSATGTTMPPASPNPAYTIAYRCGKPCRTGVGTCGRIGSPSSFSRLKTGFEDFAVRVFHSCCQVEELSPLFLPFHTPIVQPQALLEIPTLHSGTGKLQLCSSAAPTGSATAHRVAQRCLGGRRTSTQSQDPCYPVITTGKRKLPHGV